MKPSAIIFDFNGTLFWDSDFHDRAWREFAQKYANKTLTDRDMKEHIHGKINRDILTFIFGNTPGDKKVQEYASEKEAFYRELIISPDGLNDLAPGTENYLNHLVSANIPFTIATSSNRENVDFFFEHLDLNHWFQYNLVIMEENTLKPKPEPDIFLQAAEKLKTHPKDCMVIEDSYTGIVAANRAGIGHIVFMQNNASVSFEKIKPLVHRRIRNFDELCP